MTLNTLDKIELLIEELERDPQVSHEDILKSLNEIKEEIEDFNIHADEQSVFWEDLD